jgi:hypothetical protein
MRLGEELGNGSSESPVEGQRARADIDEPSESRGGREVGERLEVKRLLRGWRRLGGLGVGTAPSEGGHEQNRFSQLVTVMYANLRFFEPTRTR